MSDSKDDSDGQGGEQDDGIPLLEWIASAIGLVLTLGILGTIGWEAAKNGGDSPPAIAVTVERVVETPAGYVVEVTATNLSPATAAAVQIEGELSGAGGAAVTSGTTIDYVPGQSKRKAGLFFTLDPRAHRLEVRALGYEEP